VLSFGTSGQAHERNIALIRSRVKGEGTDKRSKFPSVNERPTRIASEFGGMDESARIGRNKEKNFIAISKRKPK
jgi:hypothetical protein